MIRLSIPKRIDLHPIILTDEWKDAFVIFRLPNAQEIISFEGATKKSLKKLQDDADNSNSAENVINSFVEYLSDLFIRGMVFDDETKTLVALKKEEIKEFPLSILKLFMQSVNGEDSNLKKN